MSSAQQTAYSDFHARVDHPAYDTASGPFIMIDEGHHNFHTLEGRYKPFAELMRADGYRMEAHKGEFTMKSLDDARILVVANALHESNVRNWYKPVLSAFTTGEIDVLRDWVRGGGSLFLIADHMPIAGANRELAAAFGVDFFNGFAVDTTRNGPDTFRKSDHSLADHAITRGRNKDETIDSVETFTGQAFLLPPDAGSLLRIPRDWVMFLPDTAWRFNANTPVIDIGGWSQGGVMKFGKGRVAVFGEAAMFTSQTVGPNSVPAGILSDLAPQNHQFLLNLIHWLDGILE